MALGEMSVLSLFKPTRDKLVITVLLVFVFALSKVPGVPLGRVWFLSNNLLAPFISDLYASIGVFDLISVVLSYLLASLILVAVNRLGVDLANLVGTVLFPHGTTFAVAHIGIAVVSALVLGFFALPLAYYSLGTQCPAGSACSPSGPTLHWINLLVDLLFWYIVWGVLFAVWQRLRPSQRPQDI